MMIVSLACLFPMMAYASGLDLMMYYGTRQTGLGGAALAVATDAYAPFYNPAGMAKIENGAAVFNFVPLNNRYKAPTSTNDVEQQGSWVFGPLFYLGGAYKLHDDWFVGLGVYPQALQGGKFKGVDFGPITDKEISVQLTRIIIGPTLAYKISDHFSVGASYLIGYNKYQKAGGLNAGVNSFHLDSEVSTWDFKGAKFSAHFGEWNGLSMAVAYRIPVKLKLEGDSTFTTALGPTEFDTKQRITIPGQFEASVAYEWIPDTLLSHLGYQYTFNSVLKRDESTLAGISTAVPAFVNDKVSRTIKYKDGHTVHFGSDWTQALNAENSVRVGVGMGVDMPFTREEYASPVLQPAGYGLIYGLGLGWISGRHEFGVAGSYYHNSKSVDGIDATLAGQAYTGDYKAETITAVVDYQIRF